MPRLTKNGLPDKRYRDVVPEAVSAHAAAVVAENPRGAPITLAAEPPHAPTAIPVQAPEAGPRCILDTQPRNSVYVMLQWPGEGPAPVCQTPAGEVAVPPDDYGRKLPVLAEIKKVGAHEFVAIQRDDPWGHAPLICPSAVECIQQFKKHFHGERE